LALFEGVQSLGVIMAWIGAPRYVRFLWVAFVRKKEEELGKEEEEEKEERKGKKTNVGW
jgi:hypothetical protein